MTLSECQQLLSPQLVFTMQDLYLHFPNLRRATVYDWQKSGKIMKLRKNRYIWATTKPHDWEYYLIANRLYEPSYISYEMALSHFGIIPEVTTQITSVTTNKTAQFVTPVGHYVYRSIKPELYFGYDLIPVRNQRAQVASLEKTVLDYLYRNAQITSAASFADLRWNQAELSESLNRDRLTKYAVVFQDTSLNRRLQFLLDYLNTK